MSRRTSEANKAIAQAWEQEKQRVIKGGGTRDWTQEQQKDILERGKAYDENGKAFEGQHMRSAEMHPECQGDPNNIQFLTREEHLAAHDGSWKNPTNWYYDPITKNKTDFGDGPIVPCKEIELSNPIYASLNSNSVEISTEKEVADTKGKSIEESVDDDSLKHIASHSGSNPSKSQQSRHTNNENGILATLKSGVKTLAGFVWRHKSEALAICWAVGTGIKAYADSQREGSTSRNSDEIIDISFDTSENDEVDEGTERDYPNERSSPCEHDVSGYTRHQNGREIHVNSYKRGGKKDD